MPPPPRTAPAGTGEPTMLQKFTMGAFTGGAVGLTIGFIFGGATILRGGAGPRGPIATLSQYMLSSAATFGFFMSIGSVIRTESSSITYSHPALRARMLLEQRPGAHFASSTHAGQGEASSRSLKWDSGMPVEVVDSRP